MLADTNCFFLEIYFEGTLKTICFFFPRRTLFRFTEGPRYRTILSKIFRLIFLYNTEHAMHMQTQIEKNLKEHIMFH